MKTFGEVINDKPVEVPLNRDELLTMYHALHDFRVLTHELNDNDSVGYAWCKFAALALLEAVIAYLTNYEPKDGTVLTFPNNIWAVIGYCLEVYGEAMQDPADGIAFKVLSDKVHLAITFNQAA